MSPAAAAPLVAYVALTVLGALRWGALVAGGAVPRLLAPVALAAGLAAAGIAGWGRRGLGLLTAAALVLALPLAGVPVRWLFELRLAVIWRLLARGLDRIPAALVPVLGGERALRTVILLGAGWLAILGGLVLGRALRRGSSAGRAAALAPPVLLVAVPAILVPSGRPYLEGAAVFALGAGCMWSEGLHRARVVSVLVGAGALAALLAPGVRAARPWIDVRHLAGTFGPAASEHFQFTQGFGPLNWPHAGREVFDVRAARPEYWKVVDLDTFDGRGFAPASSGREPLPAPEPGPLARGTQTITVNIRALQSPDVIGAGTTQIVWRLPGNVEPALSPGGFTVDPPLSPGTSYDAVTYTPRPSTSTLAGISAVPANPALGPYLAMYLPAGGATEVIQFPAFHTGATDGLAGTPYARVYALAQRLARAAPTPAALVRDVMALLGHGFIYDEHPPAAPDPLVSFLLATHRGYCQQFAGAMALLLRMGGVPARVAGGFTTGTFDATSGRWIVQDTDAHDWVEVWFPRVGWVTFDPTPSIDPAIAGSVPLPSPIASPAASTPRGRASAALRHRDLTGTSSPSHAGRRRTAARPGGSGLPWLPLLLGLGLTAGALGTFSHRRRLRRARGDTVAALVHELERALERCGRPAVGGLTLAGLERRFAGRDGAVAYVRSLRLARYAGGDTGPRRADRRALRAALGEGLGWSGRLRAWWALPPRGPASPGLH